MDRRAVFFLVAAVMSAALIPLIPHEKGKPDISWVGNTMVVAFVVLAVLSALDAWSRSRFH